MNFYPFLIRIRVNVGKYEIHQRLNEGKGRIEILSDGLRNPPNRGTPSTI